MPYKSFLREIKPIDYSAKTPAPAFADLRKVDAEQDYDESTDAIGLWLAREFQKRHGLVEPPREVVHKDGIEVEAFNGGIAKYFYQGGQLIKSEIGGLVFDANGNEVDPVALAKHELRPSWPAGAATAPPVAKELQHFVAVECANMDELL